MNSLDAIYAGLLSVLSGCMAACLLVQSDLLHGALQLEREEAWLHAGDVLWHDPVQRGNHQGDFPTFRE